MAGDPFEMLVGIDDVGDPDVDATAKRLSYEPSDHTRERDGWDLDEVGDGENVGEQPRQQRLQASQARVRIRQHLHDFLLGASRSGMARACRPLVLHRAEQPPSMGTPPEEQRAYPILA